MHAMKATKATGVTASCSINGEEENVRRDRRTCIGSHVHEAALKWVDYSIVEVLGYTPFV